MADNTDSDEFYAADSKSGGQNVMPIVEVPNEANSDPDSGSESLPTQSQRTYSDQESTTDSRDEDGRSSAFSRKKRTGKSMNGKHQVDMTPPDKLLKRAERKAKKSAERNKPNGCIKLLIKCTALARIVYGDGDWRLAKAYANLAEGYLNLKEYAVQAEYHCEHAKSILMSGVQMTKSSRDKDQIMGVLVNVYYILGRAHTLLKKYRPAEQALFKAEQIALERAKLPTLTDEEVEDWDIKISLAIARLMGRQQKHAPAIEYFEKALDGIEKKHGSDAIELIPVYQGLGKVEQNKGEHADHLKAIEHFLQAHSIASATYKDGSEEIAETAYALATAYSNVGDEDAEVSAESYLNECLIIYQSKYGPYHEKTLEIQNELARLMIRTGKMDEGIDMLKSTLEPKKEVYGEFSAEVAETWKLIGNIFLSKGDSEKSLRSLKKCHNVECMLYGKNNKKSKDTQRTIDILLANPSLAAKQKKTKAEELKTRPRFSSIVNRKK